jgi:small GTP-binding protein
MSTVIQKKICMLGDFAVGKTSLVQRYVYNLFSDSYMSTIGVNICRKELTLSNDVVVRLLIWDLAASEKFNGTRTSYLKGTAGALLVCDLTRPQTLHNLSKYYQRLREVSPQTTVFILGNKSDLLLEEIKTINQIAVKASEYNIPYGITSAKTGEGVENAFINLVDGMIQINYG